MHREPHADVALIYKLSTKDVSFVKYFESVLSIDNEQKYLHAMQNTFFFKRIGLTAMDDFFNPCFLKIRLLLVIIRTHLTFNVFE